MFRDKNKVYSDSSAFVPRFIRRIDISHSRRLAKSDAYSNKVRGLTKSWKKRNLRNVCSPRYLVTVPVLLIGADIRRCVK